MDVDQSQNEAVVRRPHALNLLHYFVPGTLASETDDDALDHLSRLRGVGRWTAEYVLLRGLGRMHIFPGDDFGARNNLLRWLGLTGPLDYEGVRRTLNPWIAYGGLIYFHLLLDRLAEAGYVK